MMAHLFLRYWALLLLFIAGCSHSVPVSQENKATNIFLVEAQQCLSQRKFKDALILLKKAYLLEPENEHIFIQINQTEDMLFTEAHQCYLEGIQLEQRGRYSKAEQQFKEAISLWPDHCESKEILLNYSILQTTPHINHSIQSGDTLSGLAVCYYNDYGKLGQIARINNFKNTARLKIGQVIKIPAIDGISLNQLKVNREKYLSLNATQSSDPDTHIPKTGSQLPKLITPSPEKNDGENVDCINDNIEDPSSKSAKDNLTGSLSQESEKTTQPLNTMISHGDSENEFYDYQWDKKVVWGLTYNQLNRLFQGKIVKKETRKRSFLEYLDLLNTAHAKEKSISYCFIDEPFLLDSCYYGAIFTMDKDDRLIQVTLTSKNKECTCHKKVKQTLCLIYGDPLEDIDKSFSGMEEYSTIWKTEDTVVIKNFSVTSLGQSCNIIYKKRYH